MARLLSTNPGLLIWLVIFAVALLVLALIGTMMRRSGVSRRPLKWFAGFMLLIGVPQFLGHLYLAVSALRDEAPQVAALQTLASADRGPAYAGAVRRLFGPDADPTLVFDARTRFADILAQAELAQFAAIGTRESVLLARFPGYSEAKRAWIVYLRITGLGRAGGKGDSSVGYVVTRPAGDRLYAVHRYDMLGIWTGPDDTAIRDRMLAGGFDVPRGSPLQAVDRAGAASKIAGSAATAEPAGPDGIGIGVAALGLAGYLLVVVLYFFKGAAWAGSVAPRLLTRAVPGDELRRRLAAVNAMDIPFRIEPDASDNALIATWRYADAKWIDHARAHGLRRTHRIRMSLDEDSHVVRATDSHASYDWSAGGGGANIQWKTALGITFYHYEHQRVFGLQIDAYGRFKPELSYAYTFNLQEMKSPLIEAVTRAGWSWRPVVWQGPAWLRWLTA